MATQDEKVAAVTDALESMPKEDKYDSVKRSIVIFETLASFLHTPEQPTEQPPEATLLLSFRPPDEMRPEVERLNKELKALMKQVMSAPPATPEAGTASPNAPG